MLKQTQLAITESDLIYFIIDGRAGLNAQDQRLMQDLRKQIKDILFIANKIDGVNTDNIESELHEAGMGEPIFISATHRRGIQTLIDISLEKLSLILNNNQEKLDLDLSIIIVSYNSRFFLELCLSSIKSATKNIDSEIIVVDNNSEDDSINMIESLFPEVLLIANKINLGFSSANNLGVKKARGKYICFLNPDTVVPEHLFSKIFGIS